MYKFTVKIKGKNVHQPYAPKYCVSCGKDISHQKDNSKFCSSKYVGEEAAHRCRNADSNTRNNLKAKIRRIESRGILFDIIPYLIVKNNKIQDYAI